MDKPTVCYFINNVTYFNLCLIGSSKGEMRKVEELIGKESNTSNSMSLGTHAKFT